MLLITLYMETVCAKYSVFELQTMTGRTDEWTVNAGITATSSSQAAQSRCTVVRPIQKSIGKWEIRPPCKIVTPKNFNLKLCIRDYVWEATHHANFGSNRFSGGFSPYRRNITTL